MATELYGRSKLQCVPSLSSRGEWRSSASTRLVMLANCPPTMATQLDSRDNFHRVPSLSARVEWRNSAFTKLVAVEGTWTGFYGITGQGSFNLFRLGLTRTLLERARGTEKRIIAKFVSPENSKKSGVANESREESPAAVLRRILATPGVHQGPACYDALSARLVEQAGFSYSFMSGFAVSATRLGAPDVGLLSYGEVLEQGRLITAAVSIPVIGDGDNGYGNALNVKRTVKGFIQAGFAGILLEDQVSPKSCGHFGGKRVVSRDEALTRIKAAVDARSESRKDIVIIARSDARQAESLDEALWRARRFAQLGADVLFIDALASKDEMLAFCKVAPDTPKMANMLEGGGRTPILAPFELEELGFKLVAYPLSLVGVSIRAMQDALRALKTGRLPPPGDLPSFNEIKEVVGINEYYGEDKRYASLQVSLPDASDQVEDNSSVPADSGGVDTDGTTSILERDIVRDLPDITGIPSIPADSLVVSPDFLDDSGQTSAPNSLSAIWSRVLRVKITGSNGDVKLDVRIPAGFLEGLSSTVPAFAGLNLRKLLDDALFKLGGNLETGQQLFDFMDRRGERIQVFLE